MALLKSSWYDRDEFIYEPELLLCCVVLCCISDGGGGGVVGDS